MYEFLKRKYQEGKITDIEINQAVNNSWITQEQANEILNGL
jgi:hypothetical protein